MKKLIVTAAIVCAAIASQAAAFDWSTKTGENVYLPGTTTGVNGATAYLFNADAYSQTQILATFDGTGFIDTSKALSTRTTSSAGKISVNAADRVEYGEVGSTLNAYFAIVTTIDDKDYLYISEVASATGPSTGYGALQYSEKTASQATAIKFAAGSASFSGSGWYTQSVPEPTSGLLLLLGMAGLALKRKQA